MHLSEQGVADGFSSGKIPEVWFRVVGPTTVDDCEGLIVRADDLVVRVCGLRSVESNVASATGIGATSSTCGGCAAAERLALLGVEYGEDDGASIEAGVLSLSAGGACHLEGEVRHALDFKPGSHVSETVKVGQRGGIVTNDGV